MTPGLPDPERDAQFYDGVPARRVVAFLIDLVVVLALDAVIVAVLAVVGVVTLGLGWLLIGPAVLASGFLYRWAMLSAISATVGMVLTGIEIRGPEGRRLDQRQALLHTGAFYLTMLSVVVLLVSMIVSLASPRGQMLHDLLIGSAAINRPA